MGIPVSGVSFNSDGGESYDATTALQILLDLPNDDIDAFVYANGDPLRQLAYGIVELSDDDHAKLLENIEYLLKSGDYRWFQPKY